MLLSPTGRLLRLGPGGPDALTALAQGRGTLRERRLGRTLLNAGAAYPILRPQASSDVTVVVPVKDRTPALARCLAALVGEAVLVVDDGSDDPAAVARLCDTYGARLIRRRNGGPAAARNTALLALDADGLLDRPFVAFLDSDCVPPPGWLTQLRGHLEDPAVAAVAPRVTGSRRSPLDLGPHPALVRPGGPVSYVPTAALLFRRAAVTPFDEQLRYGEDVDLVWRTIDAGWQVRYDPSVVVHHEEPVTLAARLQRRFRYGGSAAPLSTRHPDRLAHLVLPPWPTVIVALLLARRPSLALAAGAVATLRLDQHLTDLPTSATVVAQSVWGTGQGLGRALALLGPVGWAAARDRRLAALLVIPPLLEWAGRRPKTDPVRDTVTTLLDQAAYGAGVLAGCATHRTTVPLRPRMR